MATEQARSAGRPRPWLLAALGLVVGLYLLTWVMGGKSAAPEAPPSNSPRAAAGKPGASNAIDPADLKVRLEELDAPRPASKGGDRNPFRFYVKPPPPPPPVEPVPFRPAVPAQPTAPPEPSGPPPPPDIAMKYIGYMDTANGKIANFSDCRATYRGREGDIVAGQYRLVRIGVESVVMEYPDGRGRKTIRMSGQECVGK
jgi:hypothetical protein